MTKLLKIFVLLKILTYNLFISLRSKVNFEGTTDMINSFSGTPINFMNLISSKYIAIPARIRNISENMLYGKRNCAANIMINNIMEESHILITAIIS